jgi:glycosyltransferase involved in cell wall biosynthesis
MNKVLYISFNSITEPLVDSQVLSYLRGLQKQGWHFVLMTAEKTMTKHEMVDVQRKMKTLNIIWIPVFKGKLSTIGQIFSMLKLTKSVIKQGKVRLVHARSYFSGVVAYLLTRKTNIPYIYDIRGFWVDEKVYKGRLQSNSIMYKLLKKLDNTIYVNSKAIVSLTQKGVGVIERFSTWDANKTPTIVVIPTCVNNSQFKKIKTPSKSIVYLGSVGKGYMGNIIFKVFSLVQKYYPDYEIILISRSDDKLIKELAHENNVELAKVNHLKLNHNQVASELGKCQVGLSFIQPHYSKEASCATKIGEYLSCGIPVLTNAGIGDMDETLNDETSVICNQFDEKNLLNAIQQIIDLSLKPITSKACVKLASSYFSLQKGVDKYNLLYQQIMN